MSALVELEKATLAHARVPGVAVLEDVDWTVNAGEFWVVGGAHGSGSSSLLEAMAGLQPPLEGTVRLFGEEFEPGTGDAFLVTRRRIGLVFESGGRLARQLSAAENIALPICYHDNCSLEAAADRVAEVIERLELAEWAGTPAGRLPRGMAQRVALARALILQPDILLLDNPLADLDPQHVRWWRAVLGRLAAGDPLTEGRPLTLVATCTDFRPWIQLGHSFGFVHRRRWHALGGRDALQPGVDPIVDDLLSGTL